MNQKPKSLSFVLSLISSAIKGVIVSIILVLLLALLLKFVELSDNIITILDEVIKIISIFVAVKSLMKNYPTKTLIRAFLVGVVYTAFTFILFSALRGSYSFNVGVVLDVLLGGLIGVIVAVILNIFSKEKIKV